MGLYSILFIINIYIRFFWMILLFNCCQHMGVRSFLCLAFGCHSFSTILLYHGIIVFTMVLLYYFSFLFTNREYNSGIFYTTPCFLSTYREHFTKYKIYKIQNFSPIQNYKIQNLFFILTKFSFWNT